MSYTEYLFYQNQNDGSQRRKEFYYHIAPADCFPILRNCSGCGGKSRFVCTGCFRVNANGSLLDVWLIYSCESCGHTYNLPIFSRVNRKKLSPEEYRGFLGNDSALVKRYGTDKALFAANRAEIDWSAVEYLYTAEQKERPSLEKEVTLFLHNPLHLPVRKDKLAAELFGVSRSSAKKALDSGGVVLEMIP